jgi:hypothetical protein
MARKVGNTKRMGYALSRKKQNKLIPFIGFGAVFFLGMLAGKLEVMTFVGAFAWASVVPQWLGKMLYSGVVLPVTVPGYFGFGVTQYFDWNRLVLICFASSAWAFLIWLFASVFRR